MFIRYKIGVFAQKHVGKHKKVTILHASFQVYVIQCFEIMFGNHFLASSRQLSLDNTFLPRAYDCALLFPCYTLLYMFTTRNSG